MRTESGSDEMAAGAPAAHATTPASRRRFLILSAGVVLIAFALREWFVLASVLPFPTQGDVSGYLRYAIRMAIDGIFSEADAGQPVIPDAYRGPGYPVFLLGILKLTGQQLVLGGVSSTGHHRGVQRRSCHRSGAPMDRPHDGDLGRTAPRSLAP